MAFLFSPKVDFSSALESIMSKTQTFSCQTAAFISKLRQREVTVEKAQEFHKTIHGVFKKAQEDISAISLEINGYKDQALMDHHAALITEFEDSISKDLVTFNDVLLTYCPTAKIAYGEPCIKPANQPKTHREIRGDGNCFVSAFITRLLEERNEIDKLIQFIAEDGIYAPELKKEIRDTLESLQQIPSNLEATLQNNYKILPLINYFRQIAGNEMKKNREDYEVFFLNDLEVIFKVKIAGKSYEDLVNEHVLKMGADFSQPMITALCRKLNFNVHIIDSKIGAPQGINILNSGEIKATFCRTDAHYHVLYPQQIQAQPLPKTKITVKFDAKPGNDLYIRGNGPGMSWENGKGIKLRNEGPDIWTFEILAPKNFDYKILINDQEWEEIEENKNHKVECGKKEQIVPKFKLFANQ